MDFDFEQILFLIGPGSGDAIWNIFIYLLFFMNLFTMFRMPDKNLLPTLLIASVLMILVITKLNISIRPVSSAVFPPDDFIQFTLNVCVFIFPFLTAGMVRAKKKGAIIGPAIVSGFIGMVFWFLFWYFVQQ